MSAPRRAAEQSTFIEVDSPGAPRRAQALIRGRRLRLAIAPVAVAGALALVTTSGMGGAVATVAEPIPAHTISVAEAADLLGTSRSQEREPLLRDDELAEAVPEDDSAEADQEEAAQDEAEAEVPEETDDADEAEATEAPAEPEPAPAPDYTALGSDGAANWIKASVNVRTGPGTGFDVATSLAPGAKVITTSEIVDGWQQINRKGTAGWINARYLSDTEPAPQPAPDSGSGSSGSGSSDSGSSESSGSSSGLDFSSCSKVSGIESGLTERTRNVARATCNAFPGISSFGGYRSGGGSYHGSGRAVDAMISGEAGWDVARWARANASELGITEVIYAQKIWTTQRAGEGWRSMSDRGSVSANHYDHVHISVK